MTVIMISVYQMHWPQGFYQFSGIYAPKCVYDRKQFVQSFDGNKDVNKRKEYCH